MRADTLTRWPVLLAITLALTAGWQGAVQLGGDAGALLPIGVIGGLVGAWLCWQAVLRQHWALLAILVIDVIVLCLVFRTRDVGDTGLDWQNGMKVVAWVLMLTIAAVNFARIRLLFADPAMLAFACFCAINVLSVVYSPAPALSLVAALGVASYLLFASLLAVEISPKTLLLTLVWCSVAFCVLNLLSAIVVPDVAYMRLIGTGTAGDVRFQGLSGHPNALARMASVFAMVVTAAVYRRYLRLWSALPMLALAAIATIMSESRSALVALLLAAGLQAPRRILLPVVMLVGLLGVGIVAGGLLPDILAMVGRDGDVGDTESLAGRTELWDFVGGLIAQRPLIGYGFNSFEVVAGALWLGQTAAGVATHNAYLAVLYGTGLLGAAPFFAGLLILLYRYIRAPDLPRDLFTLNVVISGCTEIDVASISVVPTLIFFLVVALDARERRT